MNVKRLYPHGKTKAFSLTYDDGILQDIRFVALLQKYHLTATFNLNSGLLKSEYEWTHENGSTIKRVSEDVAGNLYRDYEVACHTLTHPYLQELSEEEILKELEVDKHNLEALFHRKIKGFAIPFDYCDERILRCAKKCGFTYVRISEESGSFTPDQDPYHWRATIFHLNDRLRLTIDEFLRTGEELAFCQIVGHSYDLDTNDKWDEIEDIFRKISETETILQMTTIDLICYLQAMKHATIDEHSIRNDSEMPLWFRVGGEVKVLKQGESILY